MRRNKEKIVSIAALFMLSVYSIMANNWPFSNINTESGLSDNQIRYILQLNDGRMAFATSGNLNLFDGTSFKYIHRNEEHIYPLASYNGSYRIYLDGDSLLWMKDRHKLMGIDLRQEKYINDIESYFNKKGYNQPILDLFVDSSSRIWLLMADDKLCNLSSNDVIPIKSNGSVLQDLTTDNSRLYLFYDTGEVVCYDILTRQRLYSSSAYPDTEYENFAETSLIVKQGDCIYQLRNGSKGGFFCFNTINHKWKRIFETDYSLFTLFVTPENIAYISCGKGLWVINLTTGQRSYYPSFKTINGETIDTEITTCFYDQQGGLWLGTVNRGLLYFHPARYKFKYIGRYTFPEQERTTRDFAILAFAEDADHILYFNTTIGCYQYYSVDNGLEKLIPVSYALLPEDVKVQLENKGRQVYKGKEYTALCKDSYGRIWAGTEDGLFLFKDALDKGKKIYTEDGLVNNFVHAILEDRDHNIWITTSCGISQVQIDSDNDKIHFTNYNSYDGTLNTEYINGAIFEATDGSLYFGGINGFNILAKDQISISQLPHKPLFSQLYIHGEPIKPGIEYQGNCILSRTPPYTHEIELAYDQNFISLEYTALNFLNPTKVRYRYMLEGVDDQWIEVLKNGTNYMNSTNEILKISYTDLQPGKYVLKVMASIENQKMKGEPATLIIRIYPPWWKTPLAYICYILFFIVVLVTLLYTFIHYSQRKMERKHREDMLLLRIQTLIKHCQELEDDRLKSFKGKNEKVGDVQDNGNAISEADSIFLAKAIEMVEKNLNVSGYSVEQLSTDLCMDRTGLYRKLTTLIDKSPSLFIRSIRMQKAVQLLLQGELNITEISEKVGFSSVSYFGKCFKEIYQCTPMEYVEKYKQSHDFQSCNRFVAK